MIGRVIKGKYRIYDEVGSGAFATVYVGRNMDTNEIVAIKVLSEQFTKDSRYIERFQREAMLAQRLQHPNVVRVLDYGIEAGIHFLVMEFVEGLTLDDIIQRKGRLSVTETLSYVEQACAGLQAAYEVGIVHRDIKPANLMVTPGGTIKIMDFGIARAESMAGLTQTGMFMGTPRYVSPESAQGLRADIRSDLYALGLVTYEMLVGGAPFVGDNPWTVLRQQMESDPPPIHQVRSDVPPWLEATIFRAIAKDPAQRFQTPAEMLSALRGQTATPSPVRARATPVPLADATLVAPREPARGMPRGLIIGLAAVAAVVVVGLVVLLATGGGGGGAAPTASPPVVVGEISTHTAVPTPSHTPVVVVVTSTPADTGSLQPTPTEAISPTPVQPTHTPLPSDTPVPEPTNTLLPTDTPIPEPTDTPEPTVAPTLGPTHTPNPTNTPKPSDTPTSPPAPSVTGRIAFSAGGALYVVDAATGRTQFTVPGMRQPDFRPDGQLIIANGEGAGKDNLWTINANSSAFGHAQTSHPDDVHPFWSPDGSRFTYDSLHHGLVRRGSMLYTQGLTNRAQPEPEVTLGHSGEQIRGSSPVWMHNDHIAFTGCDYWPGGTGGSKCGIYHMPSWGGPPVLIHPGSLTLRATDNHASQLVYMSQEGGNWEVYQMPAQGGAERNLSQSPGSQDGLGTFSPDGKLVAFVSNRGGGWAIWVVRTDGTGLAKLFNLPAPLTGTWTDEHISWGP
jgi:serine/threonine protein kinase